MTFLPSEKARLVLGYLLEQDLHLTSRQLLSECGLLEEVASLSEDRLAQVTRVQGTSLHQILDNYQTSGLHPQTGERWNHQRGASTSHKVMGQSSTEGISLLKRQVAPPQQVVQVKQLELGVNFNLSIPAMQHQSTSSGAVLHSPGQPDHSSTQGHSIPALQRTVSLKKRTCQDRQLLARQATTTSKSVHQKIPVQLHQGLDGKLRVSSTQFPPMKLGPGVEAQGKNLGVKLIGEGSGSRVVGVGHRPVAMSLTRPSQTPSQSSRHIQPNSKMGKQMTPDEAKMKCKLFLEKLLKPVSNGREAAVPRNVRGLVEGLLEGELEPLTFITRLQEQLKGNLPKSHQLGLVYFLRKWLPSLQDSLARGELTVEGVTVPGGAKQNTEVDPSKNVAYFLDGYDPDTVRPRTRPGVKKLAVGSLGESDSDEDDSIDGWVPPSKKLKIDESIKCGSETGDGQFIEVSTSSHSQALDTHMEAAGSERPNLKLVKLAQKVRGLAPEHEMEQEVFIKKEMFSIEELCKEEFSNEVFSKNMSKKEVIQEAIMKEEVIVYKEMCTEASLDLSSQSPSLLYVPQFTRPRSTVYSPGRTPTPPRVATTSNDTAKREEQEVASEDPRVASDQKEITSDQKEITSDQEEVTSDQEEVTSQLLDEMRTYQDMTQELQEPSGKTSRCLSVRRRGSWEDWDKGVRASLGQQEMSTGHFDHRLPVSASRVLLEGRWIPRDGFEVDELVEELEMEAVELSPEAQRTIEVFANKLLERIEEYVAEEVVKVDQVEAGGKNCICCKLEAVLETSPGRTGGGGVSVSNLEITEGLDDTNEELVLEEEEVKQELAKT